MTVFIRQERLLDADEINFIIAEAPADLINFQAVAATNPLTERPTMKSWLERFHEGFRRASDAHTGRPTKSALP